MRARLCRCWLRPSVACHIFADSRLRVARPLAEKCVAGNRGRPQLCCRANIGLWASRDEPCPANSPMTMDRAERQRSKSPAYPGTRYKGGQDHECRAAHAGLTLALGFRAGLAENADNRYENESGQNYLFR